MDRARRERLSALGRWRFYDADHLVGPGSLPALGDVRAIVLPWTGEVAENALLRLSSLELVIALGTGVWDRVDVPAFTRRGVSVANVREYASGAVAEHTVGLLLAVLRDVPAADRAVREGRWVEGRVHARELAELTLGIVGLGAIGTRVAALAGCLGMRVLGWTPHPERRPRAVPLVDDLPTLLRAADVVSLHAAWRGGPALLGREELALLRPGAILINTARGRLVDEDALAEALASGRLGGAGLDVFTTEPLPQDSPLLGLSRVVLSPHHAADTEGAMWRAFGSALDNLDAFFRGEPRNVVNPEAARARPSIQPFEVSG